jgi:hypothetical protein
VQYLAGRIDPASSALRLCVFALHCNPSESSCAAGIFQERGQLCSACSCRIGPFAHREDFGVRWQSAAATPLFDCGQSFQSGVALRFPPQSKTFGCGSPRHVFALLSVKVIHSREDFSARIIFFGPAPP